MAAHVTPPTAVHVAVRTRSLCRQSHANSPQPQERGLAEVLARQKETQHGAVLRHLHLMSEQQ